jgi:methyl-accepting chemotaxis protein
VSDRSAGNPQTGKSRRRTRNLLLQPGLQLRLPLLLLLVTLGFGAVLGVHSWITYERLFSLTLHDTSEPDYFTRTIRAQTSDFVRVSAAITIAYALVVIGVSVVYAHRLVGPTVAMRRHIEALKNGDYSVRTVLRRKDAFAEVARDLNELAEILEGARLKGS